MESKGGTEILAESVANEIDQDLLEGVNLIISQVLPEFIKKDKINILWEHLSYDQSNVEYLKSRQLQDQIDHFVFVSNWQYQKFRMIFQIPEYKSIVIKNATYPFTVKSKNKTEKLKLIYTSTPWRGLEVLAHTAKYLNERGVNYELDVYSSTMIYGDSFHEKEEKKYSALFNMCRELENVNYHGYATNDEVREAVLDAHIFAYPCIFEETSCLSAIEAMCAGCQVVTTNLGALPETCGDYATFVRFQPVLKDLMLEYCEALEKAIKNYWSDDTQELLADQSTFYNKYYSWEKRMKEWEDLFKHAKQRKST